MAPSFASSLLLLAPHILTAVAFPHQPRQSTGGPDAEKAAAVKEAFNHAWDGYYEFAFPNDELHPVSNGFGNSRQAFLRNVHGMPSPDKLSEMAGVQALSMP